MGCSEHTASSGVAGSYGSSRPSLLESPRTVLHSGCANSHSYPKSSAAAAAESLQACPTLRDPIEGSPPGSPGPGTFQARALEWVPLPPPMPESESESEAM